MEWLHERPEKEKARVFALGCKCRKNILLLPGINCACLNLGIELGIFSRESNITLVERDRDVCSKIQENIRIHPTYSLLLLNKKLHEVKVSNIDLAFIDLCGNITKDIYFWLKDELAPNLVNGADLSITVQDALRDNFTEDILERQGNDPRVERWSRSDSWFMAHVKSLFSQKILVNKTYSVDYLYYRDKSPMLLMKFSNIQTKEGELMTSSNLVTKLVNAKTPAQKSAATRVLNQYVNERANDGYSPSGVRAAIKASVTRRRNQLASR